LRQDVEPSGCAFSNLVEQQHAEERATAHRNSVSAPPFLESSVPRRRADPMRATRVLLLVPRSNVDAHHRPLVIEQEFGEGARQLGLADPGRAQEMNEPSGRCGSCSHGAGTAHPIGHALHRLLLADDALAGPAPPCGNSAFSENIAETKSVMNGIGERAPANVGLRAESSGKAKSA